MSNLNPLSFRVAIQDDATKQLDKIEQQLASLKDKTINVKVEGLSDLQNLLSALQHLQVQNIGKDVANSIKDATSGIKEEAQSAIRTSLSNLAADLATVKEAIKNDNFTAFSKRIDTCAEAVDKLDAAFKKFHVTIGSDAGMQNFMTGLGEVIRNVRTTMGTLEAGKNGGLNGLANTYAKNVERIEDAMRRIRETRLILGDKLSSANGVGIPIDNRHIYMLDSYMQKLEAIRNNEKLMHGTGWQTETFGNSFRSMMSGADQYIKYLDKQIQKQAVIETNQRKYNTAVNEMQTLLSRLSNASIHGNGLFLDTSKIDDAFNKLSQYISNVLNFDPKNFGNNHVVSELIAQWNLLKKTLTEVAKEQEKLNTSQEKSNNRKADSDAKKVQKDNEQWAESMRRANVEATKLEIQIRKLQEVESKGKRAGVDTTDLSLSIAQMQKFVQLLRSIQSNPQAYGTTHASDVVNGAQFQNTIRLANEEAAVVKRATKEKEIASRATQQLSADEQRLAQALQSSTEKLHGQSQILSDLKSLATQYLGVWGGQQFLNNIIQIGGQLEMQRLSIGAILQNQAQANELFDKIKGLATQSPFGVVELDQMTKQLTAYGFQYNELFDMTKRLADISAATGTDVSRLALALGHVRSEAALSGYTLRQFAMGNVPMLQKLSEKLGKTTEEIRKMVKAKQITYDDVVGVLKDLTDDGGMFYNMQDVISQSVKSKFKNVKDAMDIMYGEMAEGDIGEALKEVANVLMDVTRNWKDVMTVMGTGVAMWALHRAAVVANIAVLGEHNASTLKSIATFRSQEAQQLRTAAMYRALTAAEQQQIATSKLLTTQEQLRIVTGRSLTTVQLKRASASRQQHILDLACAISSKKLTTEDIARQVALGKLSKAQARRILLLADLTNAERRAGLEAVKNTTRYGLLRMALLTAWDATKKLAVALTSLVFNPATLIMAGVTALVELWSRNKREMEAAEELSGSIFERMTEGVKNVKNVMRDTNMSFTIDGTSNIDNYGARPGLISIPDPSKLSNTEIISGIETWEQFIKDYSATPNLMLNAAYATDENGKAVHSLAEQYKILGENAMLVMQAIPLQKDVSTAFEDAIKSADGGWFDDNLLTDLKDYNNAYKEHQKLVSATINARKRESFAALNAAKSNAAFSNAIKEAGISSENTVAQIMLLAERKEEFADAVKLFTSGWSKVGDKRNSGSIFLTGSLNGAFNEVKDEFDQVASKVESTLSGKGWDFKNLKPEQIQALTFAISEMMSKAGLSVDEVKDNIMQLCKERWNIVIDAKIAEAAAKIAALDQSLRDIVGHDWHIDVNGATNFGDVIDKIRKEYKDAKEYFDNVKPLLMKVGIDVSGGMKELGMMQRDAIINQWKEENPGKDATLIENAINDYNSFATKLNDALDFNNATGISVEDEKKKKGSGSRSYKDEFAKRWDERIRIMKEAYSWYEKWEKKIGNDAAIDETNAKYSDIFKEWSTDKVLPMDFDVREIKDYQKYVEKIRDDALKRYQEQKNDKKKNNGQEALRVYRQAVALLNDIKFDNFTKAGEEFKSLIEQALEDLSEKWDTYNMVRNATGNTDLALDVAGITGVDRNFTNSADALMEDLQRRFHGLGGMALLLDIVFDAKMDEESVKKMFQDLVPDGAKEKIDGLIEAYKEWQKLQKQVEKSDLSTYSKLLETVVNYDAQIRKINKDLKDQLIAIDNLVKSGKISKEEGAKAKEIATAQGDWEKMQKSAEYANLYNNAVAMSREEFEKATAAVEKMIARLKELGLLTPEQAVEEKSKLDIARKEWGTTGWLGERGAVGQFISGGYDGLMNYYAKRRDAARQGAERSTDDTEKKRYEEEAEHYGKLFQKMSKLSDAAKDVVTAFSTLQSGLDLLSNVFDSLGNGGMANAMGDASGVLGGAMQGASALSSLGPWGMAAGAGLGLISGFAQVHDKRLERKIQELREDVQKIENNTSLILQARERTLGYDNSDMRRTYSNAYAPDARKAEAWSKIAFAPSYRKEGFDSKAQKAMYEFYNKNSEGSGYQQQLANLKAQREDYMKMYDNEASKKEKSQEAMNEYLAKVAELDDQIRYFAEDIANELWGIDIKGWADQFSDALMTAFENGESMLKAFEDTSKSIMQSVAQEMLKIGILEPLIDNLRKKLFGYTDSNGNFHNGVVTTDELASDPVGASKKIISEMANYFKPGGEGSNMMVAAQEYLTSIDNLMQQLGYSNGLKSSDSSNTLSSSIQGTSEETSALLAGYVNALRQDVAVNRLLLNQYITEMWPSYIEQVTMSVRSLNNIDNNVSAIRMLLSENGALYTIIDSMKSHLDNITIGNESVSVK